MRIDNTATSRRRISRQNPIHMSYGLEEDGGENNKAMESKISRTHIRK